MINNITMEKCRQITTLTFYTSAIIFCLFSSSFCRGEILISEFMADNDSTLLDGDENYSDWIELHNASPEAVDLAGFYLTDDPADLQQWQFPAASISGGGFLVVFASGKTVDDYTDPLGYLHTNFKLSKNNEEEEHGSVLLVESDGETIIHSYVDYPEQIRDNSYGLSQEMTSSGLVAEGAAVKALIPAGATPNWSDPDYDDSTWPLSGNTGVGYETTSGYYELINLNVISMRNYRSTIYGRSVSF